MGAQERVRRSPLVVSALALVCVVAAVGAGWAAGSVRPDTRPALTAALSSVPAETQVVGFTDWERIRDAIGGSSPARRDLSTRSVLYSTAEEMDRALGWSVRDLSWEVYGQGSQAAVTVLRPVPGFAWDDAREAMEALGYAGDDDARTVSTATVQAAGLTDLMTNVALLPREDLIVLGDTPESLVTGRDVLAGRERALSADRGAADVARALAGTDSVLMQRAELGCESSAMPEGAAQQQADVAQERAGQLAPYAFSGRAILDRDGASGPAGQSMRFAMAFGSAAEAGRQARVRSTLATGPFIGGSGRLEDTLRLQQATADGRTVRLDLDHDPESTVFMVGTVPLLLATC